MAVSLVDRLQKKCLPAHTCTINPGTGWSMRFPFRRSGRQGRRDCFPRICAAPGTVSCACGSLINSFGGRSWQWWWRGWWRWRMILFSGWVAASQTGRRSWSRSPDEIGLLRTWTCDFPELLADFRSHTCLRNIFASLVAIASKLWHS